MLMFFHYRQHFFYDFLHTAEHEHSHRLLCETRHLLEDFFFRSSFPELYQLCFTHKSSIWQFLTFFFMTYITDKQRGWHI